MKLLKTNVIGQAVCAYVKNGYHECANSSPGNRVTNCSYSVVQNQNLLRCLCFMHFLSRTTVSI